MINSTLQFWLIGIPWSLVKMKFGLLPAGAAAASAMALRSAPGIAAIAVAPPSTF